MRVGDSAQLVRRFAATEVAQYRMLADLAPADDDNSVPEPLLLALFSCLLGTRLPGLGTNYLKQQTTFVRPAGLEQDLTARVTVTRLRPDKHLADLRTEILDSQERAICTGRALVHTGDVSD